MKERDLVERVKGPIRTEENGIGYLTYRWKGHRLTFLEEDVEVYEWYILNDLGSIIPVYVHQGCRDKDEYELTDKEVKNAVLCGMNDELGLYGVCIKEQAEGEVANPDFMYNEEVGIFQFRTPQELTDKETAWQHKDKCCILQRYGNGQPPRVVCYAKSERYIERLRKLFEKKYLGKGYDLFYHHGNGEGVYKQYPNDDKSILAEYEKDGIYYYNEPKTFSWLWYLMEKADCCCVLQGEPEVDMTHKLVCYATNSLYNEKVKEIYETNYKGKGYFLVEHGKKKK